MSGGGIIIQRASILLPAAKDPSIYEFLSVQDKKRVSAIDEKSPADRTEDDVQFLSSKINDICHGC